MRVPLSTVFSAGTPHDGLEGVMVLGSGAILYRSDAASPYMRAERVLRTIMPHARGAAPVRRDPPETRRHETAQNEDGRAPRIAAGGDRARGNPVSLCCDLGLRPELDTLWQHPSLDVTPKRNQELSGHCHDGNPPRAPLERADALAEPCRERARGLIAQP